ncbi:aspartate 1-decarboxylase [Streptosporangium lutulentum]|uniref:Aspartate 1-decarboxylase n=1 Tax=Streptosporangium lutulentum TaxID=1461250 RepID=A0ABT9Q4W3_9ACTN|nr:aspartate 1-decarboxylase [Streptosporangium lutulentum]MDP9841737.1 aspartate 1-decarboxylase [Streptosporangium lutulentum]
MFRTLMKSKIHRATVTQADLHYVGSVTISHDLMLAAGLIEGEKVDIVDIDNGNRLSTYVIEGPADSGVIGINGAAARLIQEGDLVIIIAYAAVAEQDLSSLKPKVVFVDRDNKIMQIGTDPAEVPDGTGLVRGDLVASAD